MTIKCNCEIDYDYANSITYCPSLTLEPLDAKRSRRCWSCQNLIEPDNLCRKFYMGKPTKNSYISLASKYLCEKCNDDYNFIEGMDWCFTFGESLQKQLDEFEETK